MTWLLLKNSLLVSALATLLAVLFGLVGALCLAALPRAWRSGVLAAAVLALALPPFLVTNCWLQFLGPAGVWHRWLPWEIMSLGGTVWVLTLLLWPLTLLAVSSAWRRLEPSQLESDMAVTGWALIRGLLLPLARPALALAAALTFVLALNNFSVPAILQVKVFPAEMWIRFNTTFDTWGALRLSWPLVLGPLLLLAWFARREVPWPHVEAPVSARLFRQQLGPVWFWACTAGTVLVCGFSAGLPLLQILTVKRTWTELPGALAAGQSAVWNSFLFAALAASIIIALSLLGSSRSKRKASFVVAASRESAALIPEKISGALTRRRYGLRVPLSALLWLPFLVPGVLLGIALIQVFNRSWTVLFYQSIGIVILAFVIRYAALGWHSVAHAVRATDPDLVDVARLEGANPWQRVRHVYWPQIGPQVSAAWYIVFLLCLWDVESMILVWPPTGETLALRIFNLLHYGHNAQVNALCLALLVLAVLPLVLWKFWGGARVAYCVLRAPSSRTTHHAPRTTNHVSCLLFFLACTFLLTSCSRRSSNLLNSKLFSRVEIIGTRGAGIGQLNKPRSLAVDSKDNLYVVDMTGRVQKFSPKGEFLSFWQMPEIERGKPKGMARDRDGNIVVVEPHYQRINHFSPEGKLVLQWGHTGTNDGQFSMPRSFAMNSHREIYVSEYGLVERVQKFVLEAGATNCPRWVATYGKPGQGPGEFNRAEGLDIDSQDRLYVADSCNHRIQIFDRNGKFLRTYGHAGRGQGELSYPYDICVDAQGRQYVCEMGNGRIQVFDAHDQPIDIIGGAGAGPGQFSNPWSIALDSHGNLYVADAQNHRVQKLIRRPETWPQTP